MHTKSRARRRQITLPDDPSAVPRFEDWLDTVVFRDSRLKNQVKLAGEELLDNLIRHAQPFEGGRVRAALRLRENGSASLTFSFRSEKFRAFAQGGGSPRVGYNIEDGRWRGLGLVMIGFLARRVRYLAGSRGDRVVAEF